MSELNEDRYLRDLLNDELWAELTAAQADDLIRKHRGISLRALAIAKQDIKDANSLSGASRHQKRRELAVRRSRTLSFLDLLNQRAIRVKRAVVVENMAGYDRNFVTLKHAVRVHRDVTTSGIATDEQLDQADADLYAVLNKITGGVG